MGGDKHDKHGHHEAKPEETKAAPAAKEGAAPAKTADADAKKKDGKVSSSRQAAVERVQKIQWTLARCQKYARRFKSEQEWKDGAPSSYKSAVAHGWVKDCVGHMSANLRLVHAQSEVTAKPVTASAPVEKVAAAPAESAKKATAKKAKTEEKKPKTKKAA